MMYERYAKYCAPHFAIPIFIVIAFFVYLHALTAGFVWDDYPQLINDERLHSLSNFFSRFFDPEYYYFRPVPEFLTAVLYSFWGATAWAFHLFSVVIHITVVSSAYLLLRRFFSDPLSFCLAFVFLVHPINVESVANIQSSHETLSALFGIWAMLVLTGSHRHRLWYALLWLAASIFTKESGLAFFVVAPVLAYLRDRANLKALLVGEAAILALFFLRPFQPPDDAPQLATLSLPLLERLLTVPKAIVYYAKTLVYPDVLAIWQNWVVLEMSFTDFWAPLGISILLAAALLWTLFTLYRSNAREWAPFWVFFLLFGLSFGGHLQIIPLEMTVADRWFYVPFVALLGLIASVLTYLQRTGALREAIWQGMIVLFIVVCAAFSWRSIARTADWHDQYTLYSRDIQYSDQSSDLLNNYGVELLGRRRYDEAIEYFNKAIALEGSSWIPYSNLGLAYLQLREYAKAEAAYRASYIRGGDTKALFEGFTQVFMSRADYTHAIPLIEIAAKKYPDDGTFWDFLVIAYYQTGEYERSLAALRRSQEEAPVLYIRTLFDRLELKRGR